MSLSFSPPTPTRLPVPKSPSALLESVRMLLRSNKFELNGDTSYPCFLSALSSLLNMTEEELKNKLLDLSVVEMSDEEKKQRTENDLVYDRFRVDILERLRETFSWTEAKFNESSNLNVTELENLITALESGERKRFDRFSFLLQWTESYTTSLFSKMFFHAFPSEHVTLKRLSRGRNTIRTVAEIPTCHDSDSVITHFILVLGKSFYLLKNTDEVNAETNAPKGGCPPGGTPGDKKIEADKFRGRKGLEEEEKKKEEAAKAAQLKAAQLKLDQESKEERETILQNTKRYIKAQDVIQVSLLKAEEGRSHLVNSLVAGLPWTTDSVNFLTPKIIESLDSHNLAVFLVVVGDGLCLLRIVSHVLKLGIDVQIIVEARSTSFLSSRSIKAVINCAIDSHPLPLEELQSAGVEIFTHVRIVDSPGEGNRKGIDDALDAVIDAIQKVEGRGACLVHCIAGVSRSATTVIAYLMKQRKMSLLEAAFHVKSIRRVAYPNIGFFRVLRDLEREYNGESSEPSIPEIALELHKASQNEHFMTAIRVRQKDSKGF